MAQLEAELDVDAALLVYCPDPAISRRYRSLFGASGLCLSLRPLIFTPDDVPLVVDEEVARASPALTVLSALCRGDPAEVESAFSTLMEALRAVGPEQEDKYYDVVLAGLPAATRTLWEKFMTTAGYKYQSEVMRNLAAKYRAEAAQEQAKHTASAVASAVALAEARAILVVLEDRGVAVPDDVRDRVLECTDPTQLGTWLHRVSTATKIDDVIRE